MEDEKPDRHGWTEELVANREESFTRHSSTKRKKQVGNEQRFLALAHLLKALDRQSSRCCESTFSFHVVVLFWECRRRG